MLTNYEREMKFLVERNEARVELVKVWPTTAQDVPACLDQWVAQIAELFGKDSQTFRLIQDAYNVAVVELDMIQQDTTDEDEPGDDEEFAAAHAGILIANARRLTAEGRR